MLTPIGTGFVCGAAGEGIPAALPLIRRFSVLCAVGLPLLFPLLWGYSRSPQACLRNNKKIQNSLLKFANYFVVDFTTFCVIYYKKIGGNAYD